VSRANQPLLLGWRLRNFKSIAAADLELAPLTVLVGANSTGKSSLIQSMLLVAQAAGAPAGEPGVPLNGPLVELGELADVRRAAAGGGAAVAIGCTLARSGAATGRELEWDAELVAAPRGEGGGLARVRSLRLSCPADGGGRLELTADRRWRWDLGRAAAGRRRTIPSSPPA